MSQTHGGPRLKPLGLKGFTKNTAVWDNTGATPAAMCLYLTLNLREGTSVSEMCLNHGSLSTKVCLGQMFSLRKCPHEWQDQGFVSKTLYCREIIIIHNCIFKQTSSSVGSWLVLMLVETWWNMWSFQEPLCLSKEEVPKNTTATTKKAYQWF